MIWNVVQKLYLNIDMGEEIKIDKRYFNNGQPHSEIPYKNGKMHGLEKWWHENGKISSETLYVNGNFYGLSKWWNPNGQLYFEALYKNNIQCGAKIIFEY